MRPLLLVLVALLVSCGSDKQEEKARECAETFGRALAEYRLTEASKLCDEEGVQHLSCIASNISDEDIEAVNAADLPDVSVKDIEVEGTAATAHIVIEHWVGLDSIRQNTTTPPAMRSADFLLPMSYVKDKWQCRFRLPMLSK